MRFFLYLLFVSVLGLGPAAVVLPKAISDCAEAKFKTSDPAAAKCVEAKLTSFLRRAARARALLLKAEEHDRGNQLWGAATEFAAIVRNDDPAYQRGFLQMLTTLNGGLNEATLNGELKERSKIDAAQTLLNGQLEIYRNPGLFASAKGLVSVKVTAQKDGKPVSDFYAALSYWPFLPNEQSEIITPGSTGTVKGAKYYVKVFKRGSSQDQGCIATHIGKSGLTDSVNVVVNGVPCG